LNSAKAFTIFPVDFLTPILVPQEPGY
jgi:hypothetical protein